MSSKIFFVTDTTLRKQEILKFYYDYSSNPPLNDILVSFDVEGLFPNILLDPTLDRVREILSESLIQDSVCDEFMELLRICLFPNFCKFNDKIYVVSDESPNGLTFGSYNLGDIYESIFQETVFCNYKFFCMIK